MTNSHSTGYSQTTGNTEIEGNDTTLELPDDVPSLMTMRKAINAKIDAMQSTGVAALLAKFADEAAALGKTPEEVMGFAGKKRGRQTKSKREE